MQFAKLFTFSTGQLLLTRSYSDKPQDCESPYQLTTETRGGGITMRVEHGYQDEAQRDQDFDRLGEAQAYSLFTKYQHGIHSPSN